MIDFFTKNRNKRNLFRRGMPGAIRTHDLQSRSLTLYPAELRAHILRYNLFSPAEICRAEIFLEVFQCIIKPEKSNIKRLVKSVTFRLFDKHGIILAVCSKFNNNLF